MPVFGKFNQSQSKEKYRTLLSSILFFLVILVANPFFWTLKKEIKSGQHSNFDLIFKITPADIYEINTRRSYYSNRFLGKIFENKLAVYLDNYKRNFFQGLDINYYFFANHPRERAGVTEKEIFFWFWFPFFLIGFLLSLKKSILFPSFLFLLILSIISFFLEINNYFIFLFPFLIYYILIGLQSRTRV